MRDVQLKIFYGPLLKYILIALPVYTIIYLFFKFGSNTEHFGAKI